MDLQAFQQLALSVGLGLLVLMIVMSLTAAALYWFCPPAGGVTVSYLEWVQNRQRYRWTEKRVHDELEEKLRQAWDHVRRRAAENDAGYRDAAYMIAVERVKQSIQLRGF